MEELGINKVADLGCGSADVIINLCKSNEKLKGIGIDISTEALNEAKKSELNGLLKEFLSEGDL